MTSALKKGCHVTNISQAKDESGDIARLIGHRIYCHVSVANFLKKEIEMVIRGLNGGFYMTSGLEASVSLVSRNCKSRK